MTTKKEELTDSELEQVEGGISLITPAVQSAREAARRDTSSQAATNTGQWLEVFTCPDDAVND